MAALALCALLPLAVFAQDDQGPGAQRGGRSMGGMFMMGGNSAHGTVTAVSGASLTIRDEQGQTWTVQTGPNTHVRKDREEVRLSDIHPGDVVVAVGNVDDQAKTVGAMFVMVLDPQQAARMEQMRATFGKTWTAGRVTAIKDLTLTLERPDKVSQTLTVNENTAFHKRGPDGQEDIAFPDIKVGDRIMARGSLQNGSFVATDIGVMPPPGERGHRPGAPGAQPPANGATPQPNGPQQ